MKNFWHYLNYKRKYFALFAACAALMSISFYLYDIPIRAVLYPAFLCMLLFFAYLLYNNRKEHKKEQDLQRLLAWEADYYSVWAHQIKTPIASMRLNLQNEDSEAARKLLIDLGRIEQYVEMVLSYLRIDSDSTDYVIREYDLDTILHAVIRKHAGSFIGKKLKLEYSPVETAVLTDEKWLSFVLDQVLSNAIKYTNQGGIRIFMEGTGTLCIADTGIGIAAEDLPRIFENGYTGFNGRSDKRATGIGLYLCKKICDRLGHPIEARSVQGQGTVIRIGVGREKLRIE